MGQQKGIYFDKRYGKYHVRVFLNGKYQHVGRYDDLDAAVIARDAYIPLVKDNLVSFADDDYYFPEATTRPKRTREWFEAESKRQLKELPARYA